MADYVLERIAQNVATSLAGITAGDTYKNTLNITRAKKKNEPRHLAGFIFQLSPDDVQSGATQADEWVQPFAVVLYVMPTDDDTTPVDQFNNNVFGDMYKAIMADYSRGGLAVNTEVKPPLFLPPVQGEFGGITFQFDVRYRNRIDDPGTPAI
jgi:hypothetical protein